MFMCYHVFFSFGLVVSPRFPLVPPVQGPGAGALRGPSRFRKAQLSEAVPLGRFGVIEILSSEVILFYLFCFPCFLRFPSKMISFISGTFFSLFSFFLGLSYFFWSFCFLFCLFLKYLGPIKKQF